MAERYRDLDLLHPDFRPVVDRFLARCVEAQIMVMIVETWRRQAAHEEDLKNGRSWVKKSKHQNAFDRVGFDDSLELIQMEAPASLAIDIAPYDQYQLHGPDKLQWDADDPVWQRLGKLGESLGLKWGGRWKARYRNGVLVQAPDMAHFQASWA